MKFVLRWAAIAMSACLPILAMSQTPSDTGGPLRETERRDAGPRVQAPSPPPAVPMAPATKGVTVEVKSFRIVGATRIAELALLDELADLVGRALTVGELEQAVQRRAERDRVCYWLAGVHLPEQQIRDGVVTIAVVGDFRNRRCHRRPAPRLRHDK